MPSFFCFRKGIFNNNLSQELLRELIGNGTISLDDVRDIKRMIIEQNILNKYNFPTKPSSDGYYHIQIPDTSKVSGRKQLKAKTIEQLQKKVVEAERKSNVQVQKEEGKTFEELFRIVERRKLERIVDPDKLISRKRTVYRDECEYNRFISEHKAFKDKQIDKITKSEIEALIWHNLKTKEMRKKALRSLCGILNQVFKYAYEQGFILDNPYTRIDLTQFNDGVMSDSKNIDKVYSINEQKLIIEQMHKDQEENPSNMIHWAMEFQTIIGGRCGEIPPLRWDDIQNGFIFIGRQQLWEYVDGKRTWRFVNHTKNHQDRTFPVTNEVAEFLFRLHAVHKEYYPDSEYLFPKKGNTVICASEMSDYFHRICCKVKIKKKPNVKRGLHSFRRLGITKVINTPGGSAYLASQLYGNSPEVALKNYYTGADMSVAKRILDGNAV